MPTTIRQRLGELLVPAIVLLGCLLYWLHVQDARSVARRVPDAVIVFTVALAMIVLIRAMFFPPAGPATGPAEESGVPASGRGNFLRRLFFIILCIGYYAVFSVLGFNLANVIFLLLAYPLAGLGLVGTVAGAVTSSAVFYGLARVMEFNIPLGPFGF